MGIANILTLLRIVIIPIFVILFYLPWQYAHLISALIFLVAAITDWLDGYLARNLKQTTALGAFLDPVADKLIVAIALVLLLSEKNLPYLTLAAAVIIAREILVSALREWMAEIGQRASVAVSRIGKVKTIAQMLAIFLLLLYHPRYGQGVYIVSIGLLYVAVILTLWSMFTYLKISWPEFWKRRK